MKNKKKFKKLPFLKNWQKSEIKTLKMNDLPLKIEF